MKTDLYTGNIIWGIVWLIAGICLQFRARHDSLSSITQCSGTGLNVDRYSHLKRELLVGYGTGDDRSSKIRDVLLPVNCQFFISVSTGLTDVPDPNTSVTISGLNRYDESSMDKVRLITMDMLGKTVAEKVPDIKNGSYAAVNPAGFRHLLSGM